MIGPEAPATRDGESSAEVLAGYFRANQDAYTPDALSRAARQAGYTDAAIADAIQSIRRQSARAAATPRARALVAAIYGVTFAGFAVLFLSKPSALQYGWGIAAVILGVTLGLALAFSMRSIGRSSPRAATVGGALAAMVVTPLVLLLVLTGLCAFTTMPVGLLR